MFSATETAGTLIERRCRVGKKGMRQTHSVETGPMGLLRVPVWPPQRPGERELCRRSEASIELS